MKILKVAFKNINSLAGAWEIDFASADFRDGLFLIAGDTGAGKTSILDAITLALFGRTARVEISSEHNEVMTRGQKMCSAEVTFACATGVYRAGWTQSRTGLGRGIDAASGKRKAANKPFGPVKRTLAKLLETGGIEEIAGTPTELQKEIISLVGISSFDQFLRTTMLAQGKFDQFLAASGKETDKNRSAILEQATGTEIYSRIGAAIHARWQAASNDVKQKEAELKGAQAMDAETRAAAEANVAALRERTQLAKRDVDTLSAEDAWHRESAKLEKERSRLEQEEKALNVRATLLAPDVQREEQARKARQLMAEFERRRGVEKAAKDAEAMAASRADAISGLQAALDKAKREEEAADRAVSAAKSSLDRQNDALAKPPDAIVAAREAVEARKRDEAAADEVATAAKMEWAERKPELEGWVASALESWNLAKSIESLAEKRAMLRPGEACPLCGATEHPFCEGQLPKPDEKKKAYEDAVRRRDAVRNRAAKASDDLHAATKALQKAQMDCQRLEDAYKKKLQKVYETAAAELAKAHAGLATAQAGLENGIKEKEYSEKTAAERAAAAAKSVAEFLARCREAGFVDEADWHTACWDEREIERVQREKQKLNNDSVSHKTRKDAWTERYTDFEKKAPSTRPAETVSAELAAKTAEYRKLNEDTLHLEGELDADAKRREEAADIGEALGKLRDELARWGTLDKELGGEGGANFKLYAQGVTLSNLIEIGNEYLVPMTNGRYVMTWDVDGPDAAQLLPTIVDRRSGGERRPVTNLSGGERFQVSLALALGLSRLNAGTLNVETLFLDEGFGTLDEKTLDVSISTLENLQRDGARTIGIISHVKELEDRISTQIHARKIGNGVSALVGAGVVQTAC